MAFDLPEPLVHVPPEQLGLGRVIQLDGPKSAAAPARSHFDFTGRPDIAHPLGGTARRHQIIKVVDGQNIDHHAAKPARFAAAHAKSPGTGDADPDLGQPADQRVGGLGRGVGLVVTHRHVASFREVKLESTALITNDHDTPGTEKQEHCSLSCQDRQMAKRRDSRERIEAQIIELGRRHLVEHGATGLSLRAIARDLGMVSSAVYRYVSSRDELLTLLLVDAYSDLANEVDRAREAVPDVWSDDVIAIARAARSWATAHPASWALLYGSPVPGYHAPAERTVGPGTRVVGALFDAVAAGIATGDIMLTNYPAPQPMSTDFERLRREFGFPGDDPVIAKCFAIWAGVVGAISLEVFGQYGGDTLSDPQAVFDTQVRLLVGVLTQPDVGALLFQASSLN